MSAPEKSSRYITIQEFVDMTGMGRQWYYNHLDDPGFPRPVDFGRPRLILQECLDYLQALEAARDAAEAQEPPVPLPRPPEKPLKLVGATSLKRRRGRPPKAKPPEETVE